MVRLWHCFSHRLGVGDLLSRPGFGLFGQLVARANSFEEVAQATPESERWERICYICAVHMSIYTHVFAYTNTCISKDVKTYVRNIYIYIYIYVCVSMYIYIHTYICTCTWKIQSNILYFCKQSFLKSSNPIHSSPWGRLCWKNSGIS